MVKRLALALVCSAVLTHALADTQVTPVAQAVPPVSLHAFVAVGTTSVCGMREAPHLIEHLLLSNTPYGENPVDAVLALRAKGIKLSAMTHSDFTEFALEGPANTAFEMEKALETFLSRSSLPNLGFEREKKTITREVQSDDTYVSSPTFYERFISAYAGAASPCAADGKPFIAYTQDAVQAVFDRAYASDKIKVAAVGPAGTFDLDRLAHMVQVHPTAPVADSQSGKRENVEQLEVIGRDHVVEVIFPIDGRQKLPADAAAAMADQARFAVQSYIRREYQLYSARTFVDQSLVGGWIRLEVPGLAQVEAEKVSALALNAMQSVSLGGAWNDPLWAVYGSQQPEKPSYSPQIATVRKPVGGMEGIRRMFVELLGL